MVVTVWVVVDGKTGEVNASARTMPMQRVTQLRKDGHEVYKAVVELLRPCKSRDAKVQYVQSRPRGQRA